VGLQLESSRFEWKKGAGEGEWRDGKKGGGEENRGIGRVDFWQLGAIGTRDRPRAMEDEESGIRIVPVHATTQDWVRNHNTSDGCGGPGPPRSSL
jgi:hypothetical protein